MVGNGVSIDSTDALLCHPATLIVVSLHAVGHAVTLRTQGGIELLMHVGIDTVMLKGEGFTPRVKPGDKVPAGAPLIQFDLDFLATHAEFSPSAPMTSPNTPSPWTAVTPCGEEGHPDHSRLS
jgi:phosphocarrier protein FPr